MKIIPNNSRAFTIIELITSFLIIAIVAAATAGIIMSLMEFFVYMPRDIKARRAASDAMDGIVEGEYGKRGIRYASSIVDASSSQFTYIVGYPTDSEKQVVRFIHDSANSKLYRVNTSVGDVNPANLPAASSGFEIPYYALGGSGTSAADVSISYPSDAGGVFTYYYSGPNINRVQVQITATSGGGLAPAAWRGTFTLRSSVEIKRN